LSQTCVINFNSFYTSNIDLTLAHIEYINFHLELRARELHRSDDTKTWSTVPVKKMRDMFHKRVRA